MKKISFAWFCAMLAILCSCKKEILTHPETTAEVNYLPGPCPYDCHDTRCQAYFNGYCGSGTTAPDQLPTAQFINMLGSLHNNILTYGFYNANLKWTNGYSYATTCMSAIESYFTKYAGGMTVSYKTDIINFAGNIFANYSYYGNPDGKALDQLITSLINQIAPTRSANERSLLLNALNIYHFNAAGMSNHQIFETILARATPLLSQYNQTYWPDNTGDCVGGYLQIVVNSANYWKYVSDYGVPPPGDGTGTVAVNSLQTVQPDLNPIIGFFKALSWPQLDAGGYLWGWGKSWLNDEPNPRKRIKAGLEAGAEASYGGWLK
jgi:hypothetical protein